MKVQLSEGPLDGTAVDVDEDALVEGFPISISSCPAPTSLSRPAKVRASEASSSTCTRAGRRELCRWAAVVSSCAGPR